MKHSALILVLLFASSGAVVAQNSFLPETLAENLLLPAPQEKFAFDHTIGPRAGFLKGVDADDGVWFVGIQWHLALGDYLTFEASAELHESEFADGELSVSTIPLQITGLFHPITEDGYKLYVLGGAGVYYTSKDYSGTLATTNKDDTTSEYGYHVGIGVEFEMGGGLTLNGDFRYIIIEGESSKTPQDDEFDYWQFTVGLNFRF